MKSKINKKITEVIESPSFRKKLQWINRNYPNLKQEIPIRNAVLEEINKDYFSGNFGYRAFAEFQHPENSLKRVDLTLVDGSCAENKFYVEFKFQFSNDDIRFKKYRPVIENNFEVHNSDLFILIVSHWDKEVKKEFDTDWDVTPDLNKYISKTDCWKSNIPAHLESFNSANWDMISLKTEDPYPVDYQFYFLKRKYENAVLNKLEEEKHQFD